MSMNVVNTPVLFGRRKKGDSVPPTGKPHPRRIKPNTPKTDTPAQPSISTPVNEMKAAIDNFKPETVLPHARAFLQKSFGDQGVKALESALQGDSTPLLKLFDNGVDKANELLKIVRQSAGNDVADSLNKTLQKPLNMLELALHSVGFAPLVVPSYLKKIEDVLNRDVDKEMAKHMENAPPEMAPVKDMISSGSKKAADVVKSIRETYYPPETEDPLAELLKELAKASKAASEASKKANLKHPGQPNKKTDPLLDEILKKLEDTKPPEDDNKPE